MVHNTPLSPPQSRIAFSSIASNTGARLPGELLMTCSTSAVAVCCSSASRVSVKSRAFSIAMTAWVAKLRTIVTCLSVNGRTSWRKSAIMPTEFAPFTNGTKSSERTPPCSTALTA